MKTITKTLALSILRQACKDRGYNRGWKKDVVVSQGDGLDGGSDFQPMNDAAAEVAEGVPIEADIYIYEPGDDGELRDNVVVWFGTETASIITRDWRTGEETTTYYPYSR